MNKMVLFALAAAVGASVSGCATHKAGAEPPKAGMERFTTDKSHLIGKVEYDRESREMRVQMANSSDWYVYRDVPPGLYEAFVKSASKGAFFAKEVKGQFPGRREE
jgi:hypothetical protein